MGCGNTKTRPITQDDQQQDFQRAIENVQMAWPSIKKIDNLGPKIFARVLHVYPMLKRVSNVSDTLKTEADLLRANEVRDLGNMIMAVYSDLIKYGRYDLNDRIQRKATILNRQQIKPRFIKHFGESFAHIATHQLHIKLTNEEKQSWYDFMNYVSSRLSSQMGTDDLNEY